MKLSLITLLLVFSLTPILAAQHESAPNVVTDSVIHRTDSTTSDTSEQAGAAASTKEAVYPLSPERQAKLIAYSRFSNIWRFAEFFISIGILALILFTGLSAKLRNWAQAAGKRFLVIWLFLVMFILAEYILSFPFHVYRGFVVENNYGFMNQTFIQWWGEDLLGLLIGCIVAILPMWFFYWLVGKYRKWWLWFSIGAIPFAIFFIVIAPVVISPLFNKFEPLKDKQLETQILALADKAGIEGSDVFQVNASKQSTKVSAYVTGLFGTKRIVLYDNLIDNFSYDEIGFVMGHEMGHYVMHHVWWGLLVAIVFIAFALWLTDKTIHPVINRFKSRFRFERLSDIASLPLVMVYLTIISFIFQPITNSASRFMEHQADKYGLDITDVSGEAAVIAFDKLSVFNLSDPDPHWLIEFWFYDHPALKKRMDFVRGYRP